MTGREQAWMCVQCGYVCDAYDSFTSPGTEPSEGDISLCMNCGRVYTRHDDRWQPMTTAEREALHPENRREIEELEWARSQAITEDLTKGRRGFA